MSTACLHCGLPAPPAAPATVAGAAGHFCCPGCAAAWQLVQGAGLGAYYNLRTAWAGRPGEGDFHTWDQPEVLTRLAGADDGTRRSVELHIPAIQCAACTWLLDQVLASLPGVLEVDFSVGDQGGRITWDPRLLDLSTLLERCAALGYPAQPQLPGTAAPERAEGNRLLLALGIAGLAMMQVMMYSAAEYLDLTDDLLPLQRELLRWAALLVGTLVLATAGRVFLDSAWAALRHRHLNMDVPVALAMSAAWFAGVLATVGDGHHAWFDSLVMFIFFLLCGRVLEHHLRQQRRAGALDLPGTATRLDADGKAATVPAWLLAPGDRLRLAVGDLVPCDAELLHGTLDLDTASLTGEARPRVCRPGATLASGCRVLAGSGEARAVRPAQQSSAARLAELVRGAQRPDAPRLSDRVARLFVPVVLLLALATALIWWPLQPELALYHALAVLVITCPCALSLAAPAATSATLLRLRRLGVAVADADLLERLTHIRHVVLDKTGTLTRPTALAIEAVDGIDPAGALAAAAALEAGSQHPLAGAVRALAAAQGTDRMPACHADNIRLLPRGVAGDVGGLGALRLVAPEAGDDALHLLADNHRLLARFTWQDPLRSGARALVRSLQQRGITVHLLSGDRPDRVQAAAAAAGIQHWQADRTAQAKQTAMRALQADGPVLFLGDGDNDAPGLAIADVAVTLGSGTDLAATRAGAVLTGNRLGAVADLFDAATAHRRVLRQNLAWAAAWNLFAVPAAMAGLVPPWAAAAGMAGSSLLVSLNASRLLRAGGNGRKPDPTPSRTALPGTR